MLSEVTVLTASEAIRSVVDLRRAVAEDHAPRRQMLPAKGVPRGKPLFLRRPKKVGKYVSGYQVIYSALNVT
jgi:hypothetical protein